MIVVRVTLVLLFHAVEASCPSSKWFTFVLVQDDDEEEEEDEEDDE